MNLETILILFDSTNQNELLQSSDRYNIHKSSNFTYIYIYLISICLFVV